MRFPAGSFGASPASETRLKLAFNLFAGLEKFLLTEKDSPTTIAGVPSNLAEWDQMRVKRRAKAGGSPVARRR